MSNRRASLMSIVALSVSLTSGGVARTDQSPQSSSHWLDIQLKAQSRLVDPADPTALHEVRDPLPEPMGVLSPDGTKVAFIGSDPQRVKDGHDFDLFVADVDPTQPSHKSNIRRLTTDQVRPSNPNWVASESLAFMAQRGQEDANESIWFVSLQPGGNPVRISDGNVERAWQLSVTPSGGIAYVILKQRKGKQQICDLIVQVPPGPVRASQGGGQTRLLQDRHISTYAFSPDGKRLAWSEAGSLHIMSVDDGSSREIPCHGIHRQLINHVAHELAWSPDGRVIAAAFGFAGGVSRGVIKRIDAFDPNNPLGDADHDEPWPRMFAEDKVFFIPIDWTPTPQELAIGEGGQFPSPMADDPNAEISPPAGDQSKPWWVRDLPMRALDLIWISRSEAEDRIANSLDTGVTTFDPPRVDPPVPSLPPKQDR